MCSSWKAYLQIRKVPSLLPSKGVLMHQRLLLIMLRTIVLLILGLFIFNTWKAHSIPPPPPRPIDCDKVQPQILVKSSFDEKLYKIDICAVATSAAGEDFRVAVK